MSKLDKSININMCPLYLEGSEFDKYELVEEKINFLNLQSGPDNPIVAKYLNFNLIAEPAKKSVEKRKFVNQNFINVGLPGLPEAEDYEAKIKEFLTKLLIKKLKRNETYYLYYFVDKDGFVESPILSSNPPQRKADVSKAIVSLNSKGADQVNLISCQKNPSSQDKKNTKGMENQKPKKKESERKKKYKGFHPRDFDIPVKKRDESKYKTGDCIFPFKTNTGIEYNDCSYKSTRLNKNICATQINRRTNEAEKIGICVETSVSSKPQGSSSPKPQGSSSRKPKGSAPAKPQGSSSPKPKGSAPAKPQGSSPSKKSKTHYGFHPDLLNIKYDKKHEKDIKKFYQEGPCIFSFKIDKKGTEIDDCTYKASRVNNNPICATQVNEKTKLARKLGVCKKIICVNKKDKVDSLSQGDKDCYISQETVDSTDSNNSKFFNSSKTFQTKSAEQWYNYIIQPDLNSDNGKLLGKQKGLYPYNTIGDGNCLFHSVVGSFELQIKNGIKVLKKIITDYQTKNYKGKAMPGKNLAEQLRNIYAHQIGLRDLSVDIMRIFYTCQAPGHYKSIYNNLIDKLISNEDINSLIKLEELSNLPENEKFEINADIRINKENYLMKLANIQAGNTSATNLKLYGNHLQWLNILKEGYLEKLRNPRNYSDADMASKLGDIINTDITVLYIREHVHKSVDTQSEENKIKSRRKHGEKTVVTLDNTQAQGVKPSPSKHSISISWDGYLHFEALGPHPEKTTTVKASGIAKINRTRKKNKSGTRVSGKSTKKAKAKATKKGGSKKKGTKKKK